MKTSALSKETLNLRKLGYEPQLDDLFAYQNRDKSKVIDLKMLCKQISLSKNIYFNDMVYVALPVAKAKRSLVVYKNKIRYVERGTAFFRDRFLDHHLRMEWDAYRLTMRAFLGETIKKIPLACENYSLVPFTLSDSIANSLWINPNCIESFSQESPSELPIVGLKNGFKFYLDRKKKAVLDSMERSFLAHGILKRSLTKELVSPELNLLEYLDLEPFDIVRDAIGNKNFQHLPFYEKNFHRIYQLNHDQLITQKTQERIYKALNIEA
ncbi:MAG TPA: hypothetical protein VK118_01905 [Tetragenococcus sp.]|nr:hypothetical protein [Tetragenococcus sp.]